MDWQMKEPSPCSMGLFRICKANTGNDPSAGSPTETLLRLLLPLGKYHYTYSPNK